MPPLGGVAAGDAAEARVAEDDPGVPVEDAQALPDGGQDAADLLVLDADLPEHVLEAAGHGVEAEGEVPELAAPARRDGDVEIPGRDPLRGVDDLADGPGHRPGQEEGQDERDEGDHADDPEELAAKGAEQGFDVLHEHAQPEGPDDPAVRPEGDAHVHHVGLEGRAGADGHQLLTPERGLDLGTEEVVLHVPGFLLRVGQDAPVGADDGDPRSGFAADGCHEPLEVPGRRPGDVRQDLAFEKQGHVLQAGDALLDVVRPHERRREEHDRRGQEDDDGRIAGEEPQEQCLFHSSSLYPTPRMFLMSEAAGPSFSLRLRMWTSIVRSMTAFSLPQR